MSLDDVILLVENDIISVKEVVTSVENEKISVKNEILFFKTVVVNKNGIFPSNDNIDSCYHDVATADDHSHVDVLRGHLVTLDSRLSALDSRLSALESRLSALEVTRYGLIQSKAAEKEKQMKDSPGKNPPLDLNQEALSLNNLLQHLQNKKRFVAMLPKPEANSFEVGDVQFPMSVDAPEKDSVDLRLPHSNPLLGDDGPLHTMKTDIIRSLENSPVISYPVVLGSSGVGKTTAAFLVAKERWMIFIEVSHISRDPSAGYQLRVEKLTHKNVSDASVTVETVIRRSQREILARALILAQLKVKYPDITPYEGLLFQLSPAMKDCYAQVLDELGDGYKEFQTENLLNQINLCLFNTVDKFSGQGRLGVILDEAHLMNDAKWLFLKDVHLNTYQTFICALGELSLAGLISVGTQVGLEQAARHASAVSKVLVKSQAYVFGEYPVLGGYESTGEWTVGKSLSRCIPGYEQEVAESTRRMLENDLQGRPRFCATFLSCYLKIPAPVPVTSENRIEDRLLAAWGTFNNWYNKDPFFSLRAELERILTHTVMSQHFGPSDILDCFVTLLLNQEEEPVNVTTVMGTVLCTKRVQCLGENEYSTGYNFSPDNSSAGISFLYSLNEPRLRNDLWGVLTACRNWSIADVQQKMLSTLQRTFVGKSSQIRGMALDEYVLFKFLVDTIVEPKRLIELFARSSDDHVADWLDGSRNDLVQVKKIVKGAGMLVAWATALNAGPHAVICGEKARHVAVLPEPNAGADGVMAAIGADGSITLITIACAWFDKAVPPAKVRQQLRTADPLRQFDNGATRRSNHLQQLASTFSQILKQSKWVMKSIMIELLHRTGNLPVNNTFKGRWVVDFRNLQNALGICDAWVDCLLPRSARVQSVEPSRDVLPTSGESITRSKRKRLRAKETDAAATAAAAARPKRKGLRTKETAAAAAADLPCKEAKSA